VPDADEDPDLSLPHKYPPVVTQLSLNRMSVLWTLCDGFDWGDPILAAPTTNTNTVGCSSNALPAALDEHPTGSESVNYTDYRPPDAPAESQVADLVYGGPSGLPASEEAGGYFAMDTEWGEGSQFLGAPMEVELGDATGFERGAVSASAGSSAGKITPVAADPVAKVTLSPASPPVPIGLDRSPGRKQVRNTYNCIQLTVAGASVSMSFFADQEEYGSRFVVSLRDAEVKDNLFKSQWNKFMCYSLGEVRRETGSAMFKVGIDMVKPDPVGAPLREEYRVGLSVLPLRFNIDQDALLFLIDYMTYTSPASEADAEISAALAAASAAAVAAAGAPAVTFIQKFVVSSLILKVDYRPKHLDYSSLKNGNYVELMNLFSVEDAVVHLHRWVVFMCCCCVR